MIVEICANSFESARAAQEGGANRIELCSELAVGGLTPSRELIEKVITELSIPTHVLIRPRAGNFVYTTKELDSMLSDITYCKQIGCDGVVSGVLTDNNNIDIKQTEALITASKEIIFTFHRAFDLVNDPLRSMEELLHLKVNRLLSSGQESIAIDGIELLKKLKNKTSGKIEIMPGSGINVENAIQFKESGFISLHTSAIKKDQRRSSNSFFNKGTEGISDVEMIREIIQTLS